MHKLAPIINDINDIFELSNFGFNNIEKVKSSELSSIYSNSDGSLSISGTLTYDYTVSYESGGQAQTHSDTATNYITFTYKKVDGKYKLTNIKYLKTYFSRY